MQSEDPTQEDKKWTEPNSGHVGEIQHQSSISVVPNLCFRSYNVICCISQGMLLYLGCGCGFVRDGKQPAPIWFSFAPSPTTNFRRFSTSSTVSLPQCCQHAPPRCSIIAALGYGTEQCPTNSTLCVPCSAPDPGECHPRRPSC